MDAEEANRVFPPVFPLPRPRQPSGRVVPPPPSHPPRYPPSIPGPPLPDVGAPHRGHNTIGNQEWPVAAPQLHSLIPSLGALSYDYKDYDHKVAMLQVQLMSMVKLCFSHQIIGMLPLIIDPFLEYIGNGTSIVSTVEHRTDEGARITYDGEAITALDCKQAHMTITHSGITVLEFSVANAGAILRSGEFDWAARPLRHYITIIKVDADVKKLETIQTTLGRFDPHELTSKLPPFPFYAGHDAIPPYVGEYAMITVHDAQSIVPHLPPFAGSADRRDRISNRVIFGFQIDPLRTDKRRAIAYTEMMLPFVVNGHAEYCTLFGLISSKWIPLGGVRWRPPAYHHFFPYLATEFGAVIRGEEEHLLDCLCDRCAYAHDILDDMNEPGDDWLRRNNMDFIEFSAWVETFTEKADWELYINTLAEVSDDGLALDDASDAHKNNERIVLAAVTENGLALEFASNILKRNKKIVMAALLQNTHSTIPVMQFVSDSLRTDDDFIEELERELAASADDDDDEAGDDDALFSSHSGWVVESADDDDDPWRVDDDDDDDDDDDSAEQQPLQAEQSEEEPLQGERWLAEQAIQTWTQANSYASFIDNNML